MIRGPLLTMKPSNPHKSQKQLWVLVRSSGSPVGRNPIFNDTECRAGSHFEKDPLFQTELNWAWVTLKRQGAWT